MPPRLLLLFPGQGSQQWGMWAAAGLPPSHAQALAPAEPALLADTRVAQPLIVACCAWEASHRAPSSLEQQGVVAIGHSVGELAALQAAGALEWDDAVALARERGRIMHEEARSNPAAATMEMVAVLGLDVKGAWAVHERARDAGMTCEFSASNGPGQQVFAGTQEGVRWGVALALAEFGGKRSLKLPVAYPFHTSLFARASERFGQVLRGFPLRSPRIPVVFNATAMALHDPDQIRQALAQGVCKPVRFTECVDEAVRLLGAPPVVDFREFAGGGTPVLTRILASWGGGGVRFVKHHSA